MLGAFLYILEKNTRTWGGLVMGRVTAMPLSALPLLAYTHSSTSKAALLLALPSGRKGVPSPTTNFQRPLLHIMCCHTQVQS